MKITVTETMFIEQFRIMNRMDNFSYDGLRALFEYFENLEDDIGEEIECDVIAICCDYHEMTISEILVAYEGILSDQDIQDAIEDGMLKERVIEALEWKSGTVIDLDPTGPDGMDARVIFQVF
jgi:hypothetical protein